MFNIKIKIIINILCLFFCSFSIVIFANPLFPLDYLGTIDEGSKFNFGEFVSGIFVIISFSIFILTLFFELKFLRNNPYILIFVSSIIYLIMSLFGNSIHHFLETNSVTSTVLSWFLNSLSI